MKPGLRLQSCHQFPKAASLRLSSSSQAQMRPKVGIRFLLNPNPQQQEPLSVSDFSLRLIDSTEYFLKEGPERMAAAARKAVKAARQRAGVRVF